MKKLVNAGLTCCLFVMGLLPTRSKAAETKVPVDGEGLSSGGSVSDGPFILGRGDAARMVDLDSLIAGHRSHSSHSSHRSHSSHASHASHMSGTGPSYSPPVTPRTPSYAPPAEPARPVRIYNTPPSSERPVAPPAATPAVAPAPQTTPTTAGTDSWMASGYYLDGVKAYRAGEYGAACTNFANAVRLEAGNCRYHYGFGMALYKHGKGTEAVSELSLALDLAQFESDELKSRIQTCLQEAKKGQSTQR